MLVYALAVVRRLGAGHAGKGDTRLALAIRHRKVIFFLRYVVLPWLQTGQGGRILFTFVIFLRRGLLIEMGLLSCIGCMLFDQECFYLQPCW